MSEPDTIEQAIAERDAANRQALSVARSYEELSEKYTHAMARVNYLEGRLAEIDRERGVIVR